jgi:hypothetical protein
MAKTYADTVAPEQVVNLFRKFGSWNASFHCYVWDGWNCTVFGADCAPWFHRPDGKQATASEAYAELAQI